MHLLLDTHALFWAIYDPKSLSAAASDVLSDPANTSWATLASAQEIALKISVGRWAGALDLLLHFDARLAQANFSVIVPTAVDYANQLRLPDLPDHRDPFDRLIVAQAMARGMALVTSDPHAGRYGAAIVPAGRAGREQEPRGQRLMPVESLTPLELPDA